MKCCAAIVATVVFSTTMGNAIAADYPAALLDTWEAIPSSCGEQAPRDGRQLIFVQTMSGIYVDFLDRRTEGGSCVVMAAEPDGDGYDLAAACRWEKGPLHQAALRVTVVGDALILRSDWFGPGYMTYHRCTDVRPSEPSAEELRRALEELNKPMDIGLGN